MATFIFFGKYTSNAMKGMSAKRTAEAIDRIKKLGGTVVSMYALIGQNDLILIVNFPGMQDAIKASIMLHKTTGILFTTSPAISVEEFDSLVADI
jgi:uncharacterized protein with GYD domain